MTGEKIGTQHKEVLSETSRCPDRALSLEKRMKRRTDVMMLKDSYNEDMAGLNDLRFCDL